MVNETAVLDAVIRRVLFKLGNMDQKELNSFIAYGQNVCDTYKTVILPNAYLNKYLEPLDEMPPEKQQAFLYALVNLHGMCDREIRMQMNQ